MKRLLLLVMGTVGCGGGLTSRQLTPILLLS